MMAECACGENGTKRLLYACSGAANTGLLADSVARRLGKLGTGSMTCLAAIGAELSGFVESAKAVDANIVLDGCPTACGRKAFERLGLPISHYQMTDYGVEKGKTAITDEIVKDITMKIAEALVDG
jgi:uncharacterized metal-binding protein